MIKRILLSLILINYRNNNKKQLIVRYRIFKMNIKPKNIIIIIIINNNKVIILKRIKSIKY